MAKLKPSQIRGTVSDWKIIVKQDDSTFREAGPSDFPASSQAQADWDETDINEPSFIENKPTIVTIIWTPGSDDNLVTEKAVRDAIANSQSGGWTIQSSGFWDYELGENIPSGIRPVSLLDGIVDMWYNAIPTLTNDVLDPAWEDINWVNYRIVHDITDPIGDVVQVFNAWSNVMTNTAWIFYVTLVVSEAITFNKVYLRKTHDITVQYSNDWLVRTPITYVSEETNLPSPVTATHFRIRMDRTPSTLPSLYQFKLNTVQNVSNKLFLSTANDILSKKLIKWYVSWPKSVGDTVSVSYLDNTLLSWIGENNKDYFLWDNYDGIVSVAPSNKIRIGYWDWDKIVVWGHLWGAISETKESSSIWNTIFVSKWDIKIYAYYGSSYGSSESSYEVYVTNDPNADITWLTPRASFVSYNTYSWGAADSSPIYLTNVPNSFIVVKRVSAHSNALSNTIAIISS